VSLLEEVLGDIRPVCAQAAAAAVERQAQLTKPRGSLGRLEDLGVRLCGMYAACPPPAAEPAAVVVFAADHGVHAQGVSPWPQEVTAQMVANFLSGGAAINVLARRAGAEVRVVDVGVAAEVPAAPGLVSARVLAGTGDLSVEPAMTVAQARQALEVGIAQADALVDEGVRLLVAGDMGIANTTASAALVSVFAGRPAAEVTGRGTGIDDAVLTRKTEVVARALALHRPSASDPVAALAAVGGLEHAAITGFLLGAAARRTPVVIDGVIACAAALVAQALAPDAVGYFVGGHRSTEPGAAIALDQLGLDPLIDLDLRLGEGTGAALAVPLVQSAAAVLREMATFDSAGVTDKG
jgi:nicotinate-nucleotide--dimethylbenzimidazole phosphoribosyltransferase